MTLTDIRKRLADCPIPEDARADWDGTNHYEITTSARDAAGAEDYWWLDSLWSFMIARRREPLDVRPEGKRLGAVLDYACAYKRDVGFLLGLLEAMRRGEAKFYE